MSTDRGFAMSDSSPARVRDWPQGRRPSWGANRPATRPPGSQLRHLRAVIRLFLIGSLLLILVPFALSAWGAPILVIPTPPSAIPYVVLWLLLTAAWLLVVLTLGWWWGPFDLAWVVPFNDAQAAAARRNAKWGWTITQIAGLGIALLIIFARAFGFAAFAVILAFAFMAAFALALDLVTGKTYNQIRPNP